MAATEQLVLLAQLGATFSGLLSIFLIFARGGGRFSPADSLRVRSIILSSFYVVFFALAPLALRLLGWEEVTVWRVASALAALGAIPTGANVARSQLRLSRAERAHVGRIHSLVAWGLFLLAGVLIGSNVVAAEPGPALYVLALCCGLGIGASNFVTIAFQRLL